MVLDKVQITDKGLFVPREVYQDLGEIEVVRGESYILIKPKNLTAHFSGFIRPRIDIAKLHEDYEFSSVSKG